MSVVKAYIVEAATGEPVEVGVHDLTTDVLLDLEEQWRPARLDLLSQLRKLGHEDAVQVPESLHWDWARKGLSLAFGNPAEFSIKAVRRQATWEGVALTRFKGHAAELAPAVGLPLAYLDFLEVAPWNWSVDRLQVRRFKTIGPVLLRTAVEQSYTKGWDGRLGLHALPQAVPFYQRAGLQFIRNDPAKQNLPYYEFSAAGAQTYTGRRG